MSIEAMKRIKSWLQDTKMIDSHTISAVVAECDMAILAQQPATAIACGIPGMAKTTCPYCEQGFAFEHEQPATGEPFGYIHHFAAHDESGALIDTTWEADGCADPLPHPTFPSMWKWAHCTPFYTTPQPAQVAQATQVEVTDGIRPEDFTVDVVVKPMGGFAQINTKGVRVTHKPTGISVTCDAARSQHANRNQAIEKLNAILAQRPERVPMTDEREAFESCALMEGSLFKRRADDPDKYWDGNVQDDWELWKARAQVQGEPVTVAVDHFDNGPFEAYTNRIYPHVEIGT